MEITNGRTVVENNIVPALNYIKSRNELLRDYGVHIKFLSVGCVISVGCKEIPFSTVKEGMRALNDYVENPYEERNRWEKLIEENNN